MFWSANYIVVRELNFLLKVENVTLTQVLEADDILQECKADNKSLMQFLTKPKILAELITLITEEPPKNVELTSQYRHASIACEVLTSHLSTLSDRLSMDVVQMNRLCDFINKDPPLNPLLASYFSKTVEMLLERGPKQDWYLYHIVCLRVLDFFKSRRDFLPNLLRHISTSAIADTFKYFIRLDDLFNKIIMEWFEEHQFLECLIQIICGTYVPEPLVPCKAEASPDQPEKGQHEASEKPLDNHTDAANEQTYNEEPVKGTDSSDNSVEEAKEAKEEASLSPVAATAEAVAEADSEVDGDVRAARIAAVASANAAALLCDLILSGCAGDGCNTRPRTSWALVSRLQGADAVRLLLQGVFTAPAHAREHALVHGAHVLLALLDHEPILGGEGESERTSVELAVAPHLPLLHQALLQAPDGEVPGGGAPKVGLARVQVAALLAHLALSEVQEVCGTMLTLGTPGVLLELFFSHEHNNFLHAQVAALVNHALSNRVYRTQYARHLLVECDLLTRLLDVFEENENNKAGRARAGYMGHVVGMLRRVGACVDEAAVPLPAPLLQRWAAVRDAALAPLLLRHDTPLGGCNPLEIVYEIPNDINADDDVNELCTNDQRMPEDLDFDDEGKAESNFLELANQRFGDNMWEDSPEADDDSEESEEELRRAQEVLAQTSPWESTGSGSGGGACAGGGEGWAQFDAAAAAYPPPALYWAFGDEAASDSDGRTQENIDENMRNLHLDNELQKLDDSSVELATKLLTAMNSMSPEAVADIVNGVPLNTHTLPASGFPCDPPTSPSSTPTPHSGQLPPPAETSTHTLDNISNTQTVSDVNATEFPTLETQKPTDTVSTSAVAESLKADVNEFLTDVFGCTNVPSSTENVVSSVTNDPPNTVGTSDSNNQPNLTSNKCSQNVENLTQAEQRTESEVSSSKESEHRTVDSEDGQR